MRKKIKSIEIGIVLPKRKTYDLKKPINKKYR